MDIPSVKSLLDTQVSDFETRAAELQKGDTSDPELLLLIDRFYDQVVKVRFVLGQIAEYQAKLGK